MNLDKGINVLSLCDGMSCGQIALERAGIKVNKYFAAEIKDIGIKVTLDNYPNTIEIGDVNKIFYKDGVLYTENGNYEIPIDLVAFGSPCFTGDTLVLTNDGYKNIIDIKIGDYVLAHDNKFHKVIDWMNNGEKDVYCIDAMCTDEIKTTSNHKFYVRKKYRKWNNKRRSYDRMFGEPEWIEVKDIIKDDYYLGYAINQENKIPEWNGVTYWKGWRTNIKNELNMSNPDLWYIVGRWLGDGWLFKNRPGKYRNKYNGFKICCSHEECEELEYKIGKCFHFVTTKERTVCKIQVTDTEMATFLSQFGDGAKNKFIPKFVMDLPIDLLKQLLYGYFDADGCKHANNYVCSSISRELIYGIGQCVAKVYHRPFSIRKIKTPDKYVIEGRIANQNDYYRLFFKKETGKQDHAFYENGYLWFPIRNISKINKETVYDITVEEAHSFTANGVIVHNCQSFSLAMKSDMRIGIEDKERSGLFLECYRILKEVNPKYFFMENVASMRDSDKDFISDLLGVQPYKINADKVSPALRNRYYWTNIEVKEKIQEKDIKLNDILENGWSDRNKARSLLVSDSRPLTTPVKMFHRYYAKGFTTLIFKSEEHYKECVKEYIKITNGTKIKAADLNNYTGDVFNGVRYLNQNELEKCQCVPEGYTKCLTRNEAADVLGDGWNIDVITYFFKYLTK